MGKVLAVCSSSKKGTEKAEIDSGYFLADWGLKGDAHAGNWHRQVSLLSADRIDAFNDEGAGVKPGAFGENLIVSGFDFSSMPVGTKLRCRDVLLEITQIGKECHTHCNIHQKMGRCIMPSEGVFAGVLESGYISTGDDMVIDSKADSRPWQAAILTLSDKAAMGLREDKSGKMISQRLKTSGYEVIEEILMRDEIRELENTLIRLADQRQPDLILTTGGTGFSPRDITPEATMNISHRNAPGISEAIRAKSMTITSRAMLSRGVSVIRGKTLIINLPGSPKACMESMDVFMDVIDHAMGLLRDNVSECAADSD